MTDSGLITNARLMTANGRVENGWLYWRGGRIESFGAGDAPPVDEAPENIDAGGKTVLPGFIDVHVHGGDGFEAMDATHEALHGMARFYAQHGVTSFLATTWTESRDRIGAALLAIAGARGTFDDGATLLGAHVEGPYLNPKKCGAQSTKHIRLANPDEALAWLDLDVVLLLALAPEFEENHWLIRECVQRGIVVSAAHTEASYEQMQQAVDMGVRQATHTFNAMVGLHHREPGTVGAALSIDDLNCELIADNIHVHPAVIKIAYRAKGAERLILITDAVRGAGLPPGLHQLDDRTVTIDPDSSVRLPDGTLAGSTLTMERALHNLMDATGESLETLWRTSSLNAACALGIDNRKGSIAAGKDADLALVDDEMNVSLTVAEGRVIFRKK